MKVMNGPHRYVFTQFEECFMRAHFHRVTNPVLAMMLGHKLTLVRTKCYELGLKRMELEYWTDEQVKYLKDNYRKYGDTELAELFAKKWHKDKGWSKKHIEKKRRYLNLKRTDKEKAKILERNITTGRFVICNIKAWNARGVAPVFERRLWKRSDSDKQFIVIKLKDGWVHYAPWLWEQIRGPVPHGCIVAVKDGDPLNITIENLELLTWEQNGARNSKNRMPAELWEVNRLTKELNKLIRKNEQQH